MATSPASRTTTFASPGRPGAWLIAFLLWTVVALVFAVHFHVHYAVAWTLALRWAAVDWYVWAGLSVGVLLLSRRMVESGLPVGRAVAAHACAMGVVISSHVALVILIDGLLSPADIGFWPHFEGLFAKKLGINVVTYGALAALSHLHFSARKSDGFRRGEARSGGTFASFDRLLVERRGRESLLDIRDIRYVEASGNYVNVHAEGSPFLLRRTLGSLEEQLGARRFARISRSALVNLDRIDAIERDAHGAYRVVLQDGAILRMTRAYRKRFVGRYGPHA